MPRAQANFLERLGVSPESIGGEFRIIPPEDPQKRKYAHDRGMLILWLSFGVFVISSLLTGVLFALCLHYGKPEIAKEVVAIAMGAIGGFGAARVMPGRD